MKRWKIFVTSVALIAVVAYGAVQIYWSQLPHGVIVVSSPTIYTRQRLVNDRLLQEEWLDEQLKLTSGDKTREFRSIDAVEASLYSSYASGLAKLGSADGSDTRAAAPSSATPPPSSGVPPKGDSPSRRDLLDATPDAAQTTLNKFVAMNNYRDVVRSELMQTLLDDRHDITGNTVYRLGFNASVVAGHEDNKFAAIIVTLCHTPSKSDLVRSQNQLSRERCDQTDSGDPSTTTGASEITQYTNLYDEWVRTMNETANKVVEQITNALLTTTEPVEPADKRFREYVQTA